LFFGKKCSIGFCIFSDFAITIEGREKKTFFFFFFFFLSNQFLKARRPRLSTSTSASGREREMEREREGGRKRWGERERASFFAEVLEFLLFSHSQSLSD